MSDTHESDSGDELIINCYACVCAVVCCAVVYCAVVYCAAVCCAVYVLCM